MSKYKNYLIVGGAGQDAYFLTELLLKKKSKIYLLINRNFPKIKKNNKRISIKKINIFSAKKVHNFLNKFKELTIFFLASYNISTIEKESLEILNKNLLINVSGLANFLEHISKHNKKMKLFYACSSHIYNDTKTKLQNENTKPIFNSNYGLAKYLGKETCDFYRTKKKIFCSTGILYSHVSKLSNKNFLINGLLSSIKKNKKKIEVRNSKALIDFISSKDAVKAMYKIMQLKKPDNFIISSNKLVSVLKIIKTLKSLLNLPNLEIENLTKRLNDSKTILKGNNSKILNYTNWKPEDNLKEILRSFLKK
jgi:GDP-D-mannose dehydratase